MAAAKAKKPVLPSRAEPEEDSARVGCKPPPAGTRERRTPPPAPEPFTEADPPPRRRPVGEPAPRHIDLPPGETALAYFRDYDAKGRVPAGSVLAEFRGTGGTCRIEDESGYWVVADPAVRPVPAEMPAEDMRRWSNRVVIRQGGYKSGPGNDGGKFYAILSPRGAS